MAAPVSLAFRIAANLTDLRANLKDATNQIETTTSAMTKMANSLDGSKLIADANAMVKVVNDLGGASKLTEAEQARVNRTLTDTIAKYEALGHQAPPAMLALKQATDGAGQSANTFNGLVGQLTERIALVALLHEAFDFGKEILSSLSKLEELHLATGITTDDLQRLSYVGTEFGLDTETMGRAVEQLSAKLANGDKNATSAVEALGLSVKDLIAAGPKEAFLDVADAAGRVEDPMTKAGIASDVFGAKLSRTLLPSLRDLRQKMNEVPKDAIISEATIKSAHDFEVGLEHLEIRLKSWVATAAEAVHDGWIVIGDAITNQRTLLPEEAAMVDQVTASLKANASASGPVISNAKLLANHLNELRTGALTPLTDEQKRYLDVAMKANESIADSAKWLKVSEGAVKRYEEAQKSGTEAAKKYEEEVKRLVETMSQTQGAKALDEAITRLGGTMALTNLEWTRGGAAAAKLRDEGALLTPQLQTLAEVHDLAAQAAENARIKAEASAVAWKREGEAFGVALRNISTTMAVFQAPGAGAHFFSNANMNLPTPGGPGVLAEQARQQQVVADATFNHIEESMRRMGVLTQAELDGLAAGAEVDFQDMAASGLFTAQELMDAWQRMVAANIAAGHGLKLQFEDDLIGIGAAMLHAFATGGSVGQAARAGAVALGSDIGKDLMAGTVKDLAKSSPLLSKALGDLAGPLGGAVVALGINLGEKLWNSLFGTAGRDLVTQFAATFGGFDQLHAKLLAADAAGEKLWIALTQGVGRNNPQQAQQIIGQINALLKGQDDYLSRLPNEMQKYGLTWEQAGKAAEQSHLDSIGADLVQTFADLTKAGFDVDTVTQKMSSDIDDYIHEALRTGTEVPAAMKPLLQHMIDLGTLTDDAGNKITSLDSSGLKFSETLTEGFQSVVDAIHQMVYALTGKDPGSLTGALETIGNTVVSPHIKPILDTPDLPPGYANYGGAQAAGGDYYVTKPTWFLAGEAGPERATFSGANKAGSAPSGGDTYNIIINGAIDGPSVQRVVRSQEFAEEFSRVVKTNLNGVGTELRQAVA